MRYIDGFVIATQTLTMEGQGQFIEGTCTGGTVTLRGIKTVSGITNVTLNDDSTLGYEGGAVWFNDVGGEAGTANGIGSISRPSSVIADMRTIADSLNLKQIKYVAGSTLTLDQSYQNFNFLGTNALINFNGQDTSGSSYMKSGVTGTCTGAVLQVVDTCGVFGPCSMPPTNFLRTTFETGTFTCSATGRYTLHECLGTKNAGGSAPVIDVNGDGINPRTIHAGKWSGDIEFATITSTDVVLITGFGSITLAASCTGGTITIDGDFIVTDNSGGAVTIVRDEDTVSVSQIGTAGAGLTDLGGMSTAMKAEVNVEADTALVDYDPPTNAEMVARTLAAADYFDPATDTVADVTNVAVLTGHTPQTADHTASISSIKEVTDLGARAAAVTGTLSTTQMSTDLTEVTDDHYLGRLVTWTSGVLAGQQSDVTAYNGTTKVLTFTATTDAPANGDTFILS